MSHGHVLLPTRPAKRSMTRALPAFVSPHKIYIGTILVNRPTIALRKITQPIQMQSGMQQTRVSPFLEIYGIPLRATVATVMVHSAMLVPAAIVGRHRRAAVLAADTCTLVRAVGAATTAAARAGDVCVPSQNKKIIALTIALRPSKGRRASKPIDAAI